MLTPPAQLKYLFDKNNNNKLSSTQKINCAQQSDRQEGPFNALHRGARQGEATPANRGARGTERVLKSDAGFRASSAGPLAVACPRVSLHCPSSSSRPPCLLFLGLSLCIFWAAIVRGCLAKSPDALQSTCQLQQQGNELIVVVAGQQDK